MSKQVIIEFRAELDQFKSQLKSAQNELEKLKKKGEDAGDGVAKGAEGASKSTKQLITTLKELASAVGLAFGAREIINFTREAVTLAGKLQGVEAAFNRIGDPTLLQGLREATRGTVSDLQLMQSAVRASNFEIPLEQLASLFEFARRRAKETGEEVDYLVESIILGIGRKSPLILDNLGISAVRLRQELNGVSAEAATVGDVAAVVGRIATEALESMGDEAETAADKQQKLAAQFVNLKIAIGEQLIPAATEAMQVLNLMAQGFLFLLDGIDGAERAEIEAARSIEQNIIASYAKRIKQMAEENRLHEIRAELIRQGIAIDKESITEGEAYELMLKARIAEIEKNREGLVNLANAQKFSALGLRDFGKEVQIADQRLSVLNMLLQEYRKSLQPDVVEDQVDSLKNLQEQIKNTTDRLMEAEIGSQTYRDLQAELIKLKQRYDALTKPEQDRTKRLQDMQRVMEDSIRLEREFAGGMDDLLKTWNQGFINELYGTENVMATVFGNRNEMLAEQQKREDEMREQEAEKRIADSQRRMQEGRELYMNLGMTEEEYTQHVIKMNMARAKSLRETGDLTQEEYERIIKMQEQLLRATQDNALNVGIAVLEGLSTIGTAMIQLLADQNNAGALSAAFQQTLALFQISIQTAEAIAAAVTAVFKDPTQFTVVQKIAAVATATGLILNTIARARRLAQGEAPTPPTFAQGGWIGGRSHADGGTLIEAEAGEFIINKRDARANKDILKAINTGNLSKYVVKHYVEPLTKSMARDRNSLAENIAASLAEQMTSQNSYLRKISRGKVEIINPDAIARAMRPNNINRFKV